MIGCRAYVRGTAGSVVLPRGDRWADHATSIVRKLYQGLGHSSTTGLIRLNVGSRRGVVTWGAWTMIELSDMIRQLRDELNTALGDRAEDDGGVRFELGPVEIEATVAVGREGDTNGKIRFWVVEAGGSGRNTESQTQRIKLTLQPKILTPDGTPQSALIAGGEVDGER